MKVYEAIAQSLKDLGVEQLFGLMGDANLFMVDHYIRHCKGGYTGATHEAAAVMMALAWGRVRGETGVATVTHGPALTNTITALIEGVKTATPMVLLAGDTTAGDWKHAQYVEQREFITATGARFEALRSPATLAEDLARAFQCARQEMRPVVLNMPVNYMWQDTDYVAPKLYFPETASAIASSDDMDRAIGIIAMAKRPVVLGGYGIADAKAEQAVLRFAERIEAPVATTVRGKGLFAKEPFNVGISGTVSNAVALDVIAGADCIIAFGASLTQYTTGEGGLTRGKRLIQINPSASQIGRHTPVDAGLVGDPGLTAEAMMKWLDEAEISGSGARTPELAQQLSALRDTKLRLSKKPKPGYIDFFELLQTLDHEFPKDRVLVTDTGRFLLGVWPIVQVQTARDYVDTIGFASIGLGLGAAIGAAKAAGDRPTLFVAGDGGFMLGGVSELATVVREQLNMVIVICNDNGYGAEYIQYTARNMDPALSLKHWPDLAPIAQAFGLETLTVRSSEELKAAMDMIAKRDTKRPLLIEAKIDPAAMPGV